MKELGADRWRVEDLFRSGRRVGAASVLRLVCILVVTGLMAQPCAASALGALDVDFVGRGSGMVGWGVGMEGADNLMWNASGLAFGRGRTAFGGFMDYLVGLKGGTAGYIDRTPRDASYGFWVSYLSSGSLARTGFDDPTGEGGAAFTYSDVVSGFAGAYSVLPFVGLGATLKFARQDVGDFSASGLFGDASVTFKAYAPDLKGGRRPHIYTSYTARNIELARWEQSTGTAPIGSEAAVVFDFPAHNLTTGLLFTLREAGSREVRWSLEAAPSDAFEVRLGYRRRTGSLSDQANDMPWERGILAGFGLRFGSIWIDYAFEDASPLDNIHRFGVRSVLGGLRQN
jgi:hypothetical protein